MSKFYGAVGYSVGMPVDDPEHPDVWVNSHITERMYKGDIYRNSKTNVVGDTVVTDISLNSSVSIVADAFAYANYWAIKYVVVKNSKWAVTSVEVQHPRLILNIGGVYNG